MYVGVTTAAGTYPPDDPRSEGFPQVSVYAQRGRLRREGSEAREATKSASAGVGRKSRRVGDAEVIA